MASTEWTATSLAVDGARLHVKRAGSGSPLVLVHGTGTDSTTWDPVVAGLGKHHEVIAYDRRGYGRSENRPVRDYRTHIADLAALLETVAPAHVLGWSSGGNVALALATQRPELFRSLIVLEPPFHGTRHPRLGMVRALATAKLRQATGRPQQGARSFLRWVSTDTNGGNAFDHASKETQAHLLANTRQILAELDPNPYGVMVEFVPTRRLASLRDVPVTWMIGGNSFGWFDNLRHRAVRFAPHIRTVVIEGAGHLAHHEKTEDFISATLETTLATETRGES